MERERQALARGVAAMQQGAQVAVRLAVQDCLAGASVTIAADAKVATQPVLETLAGVVATAKQAEAVLRRVVLWASWRLLGWILGGIVMLGLLLWLTSITVLWWDTDAIVRARAEKTMLGVEIDEMQRRYDELSKNGGLGKLNHCGSKGRLCIQVDERAGSFGGNGEVYRVIQGY